MIGIYDSRHPQITLGLTIILFVVFILGFAAGYYYKKDNSPTEKFGGVKSSSKLTLYFAPWCGWSKKFLPAWEELQKQNLGVEYITLNCDEDKNKQMCGTVNGFPSVVLTTSSGKNITYNGNRTVEDLVSFVKTNNN